MTEYLHTTSHDFKSNFSRYLKYLMAGQYQGILVKHYTKPIGVFALLEPPQNKIEPNPAPDPHQAEEEIDIASLMKYLNKLD